MCGRFTLRTPASLLVAHFRLDAPPPLSPRYNIAPTQPIVTVALSQGTRQGVLRRWGLVPSWADDPTIGNRMINARAETIADKPAFRAAFKRRRCLIPADGYYEWQATGRLKQPFLIHLEDDSLLAFAGLWEHWSAPDGSILSSCTVITTTANDTTRPIHDRMPVILDPADYDEWLSETNEDRESLLRLLRPYEGGPLIASAVSTYVNNPRHEDAACVDYV